MRACSSTLSQRNTACTMCAYVPHPFPKKCCLYRACLYSATDIVLVTLPKHLTLPLFRRLSTVSPAFFGRYPRSSLHSFVLHSFDYFSELGSSMSNRWRLHEDDQGQAVYRMLGNSSHRVLWYKPSSAASYSTPPSLSHSSNTYMCVCMPSNLLRRPCPPWLPNTL